jgi:hypothetical protein
MINASLWFMLLNNDGYLYHLSFNYIVIMKNTVIGCVCIKLR